MELIDLFQRVGLAIAIGFAAGVERGWKTRLAEDETRVAGLRTHTLIGLLGALAALLGQHLGVWAFAVFALVFGLAWVGYKAWETHRDGDISITGLVGGLCVFALGAYAMLGDLQLAAACAVVLVSVLAFKQAIHNWLGTLTWAELRSALIILAATFVALPLLPDHALDPYGAFNPRALWLLTVVLAGASFFGYVALRVLGPHAGLYLGAGAGALVSSTAATLDLARRAKADEVPHTAAAAAAALANLVMFTRVAILLAALAPAAMLYAAPALGAAAMISAVAAGALALLAARDARKSEGAAKVGNPLDLLAVGRLAGLLALVTVLSHLVVHFFGDAGLSSFAVLAGLVDVDAVTLAVSGFSAAELARETAAQAVLLAVAANTCSKLALGAVAGGGRFAALYGAASLAALLAGLAAFLLMRAV